MMLEGEEEEDKVELRKERAVVKEKEDIMRNRGKYKYYNILL